MSSRTSELVIRLRDQLSGPAKGAAGALDKLSRTAKEAGRGASAEMQKLTNELKKAQGAATAFSGFQKLRGELPKLRTDFNAAQDKVKQLAREMAATEAPTSRMQAAMTRARNEVQKAHSAYTAKARAIQQAKAAVNEFGVSTDRLGATQSRLASHIDRATAAIKRQSEEEKRAARAAEALAMKHEHAARKAAAASKLAEEAALRAARAEERAAARRSEALTVRKEHEARKLAAIQQQAQRHQDYLTERSQHRRQVLGGAATLGGGYAAYRGRAFVADSIRAGGSMDLAVRKQRAVVGISEADQNELLIPQAKKIGQETSFTNEDVIVAQSVATQGLPASFSQRLKAEVAHGIVEGARDYAIIMSSTLEEAAEGMRTYLQTTGQDISTKEKALAAARKANNQMVAAAKLGGMSDDDVQAYLRFGAPSATVAGISPETLFSIGALGRRAGYRGDVMGVAMRSASSKLVSPTAQGLAALDASGIRYDDYTKMPGGMSADNIQSMVQRQFGKNLTSDQMARMTAALENPDVVMDRESFITEMTGIIGESFDKKKDGKLKAVDANKIAKNLGSFYQTSLESIDVEGLLNAIMSSPMGLAAFNAMFTDKHGGKFALTQKQWDEFAPTRQAIIAAGNDPNFTAEKVKEILGGLGGALENLTGSIDNLKVSLAEANTGVIKFTADSIGGAADWMSNLSDPAKMAVGLGIGGATVAGAGAGVWGLISLATAGPALVSSAAALDGAAAALVAAAGKQGGLDIPGGGNKGGKKLDLGLLKGAGPAGRAAAAVEWLYNNQPEVEELTPEKRAELIEEQKKNPVAPSLGDRMRNWMFPPKRSLTAGPLGTMPSGDATLGSVGSFSPDRDLINPSTRPGFIQDPKGFSNSTTAMQQLPGAMESIGESAGFNIKSSMGKALAEVETQGLMVAERLKSAFSFNVTPTVNMPSLPSGWNTGSQRAVQADTGLGTP